MEVSMLTIIALIAIVLIVALLIYAATRPDTFRIQRSATIKAPPEKVFTLINDFHSWLSWSPWENIDPMLKRSYGGASSGRGAVYEWEGNNKVGKGRMEITKAAPPSQVVIKLDFMKPFEAHNTAEFTMDSRGDSTHVTWAMYGPNPFMAKVMQTFISMDRMVGKQFETGLANLKTVAET
jgi:uncharacterized protein YndB with AHSA1/START domain